MFPFDDVIMVAEDTTKEIYEYITVGCDWGFRAACHDANEMSASVIVEIS